MHPPPLDEASGKPSGALSTRPERAAPVAVVVVTGAPLRREFLETLRDATEREIELVQVRTDPGAGDGSTEPAAVGNRTLVVGVGTAYGAAANAGIRDTTAELVAITSPAIRWEPGALDELLAAARRWPTGATFGPLICLPDGSVYPSARSVPTLGRGIGHALFGRWWPSNPWTRGYRGGAVTPVERTTGWLSGSCLLLRRDAFDSIGGFDPGFIAFFEDVDLGERLGRAHWHNVYVPAAVVRHIGAEVTGQESATMTAAHHRSALRYLSRRYSGLRWLPLRLALRLGLAVRSRLTRGERLDDAMSPDDPDGTQAADTAA
jgi:N-acetylglucosaminyl-diphospho-decaprenol L-rhamnosyltransferase